MGRRVLGMDRDTPVDRDEYWQLFWELGNKDVTAKDIAALAALLRTTFGVLARTLSFDPEQHELCLSWTDVPTQPALTIAAATSELHVQYLILCQWDADWGLLRQFAETHPDLVELTLERCRTNEDTWDGLNAFSCVRVFNLPARPRSRFDKNFRRRVAQDGDEDG